MYFNGRMLFLTCEALNTTTALEKKKITGSEGHWQLSGLGEGAQCGSSLAPGELARSVQGLWRKKV